MSWGLFEFQKEYSETYCELLNGTMFKQWFNRKPASFKKAIILRVHRPMHPSTPLRGWLRKSSRTYRVMVWPPASPDLNPIENFWSLLRQEIYKEGKQYTFLNSLKETVMAAASKTSPGQIKNLTNSVDGRLTSVIERKKGRHMVK